MIGTLDLSGVDILGALQTLVASAAATPLASARAKVLEQTAAFYKLPAQMDAQRAALATATASSSSLTTEQRARVLAAQQALDVSRSTWTKTNGLLSSVNQQLQANTVNVSAIAQAVAGVAASKQAVDTVDRALGTLKTLKPSSASSSPIVSNGLTLLLLAGLGFALVKSQRHGASA